MSASREPRVQAARTCGPGVFVYTIAYGVAGSVHADDREQLRGNGVNSYATRMFARWRRSRPSTRRPQRELQRRTSAVENTDDDYYFCTPRRASLADVFRQIVHATDRGLD